MDWLADTGCDMVLISTRVYLGIPAQERPKLRACSTVLTQADGQPLDIAGAAQMTIKIEKQKFHFEKVVADCESDGLLGLEFLEKYRGCINVKNST